MTRCAVLLAGGNGKRLWPISTLSWPKQFCTLPNNTTLCERTAQRISLLKDIHLFISTTEQYEHLAQKIASAYQATLLIEPATRNTAPAIAYACRELLKIYDDALVIILPTDHLIAPNEQFCKAVERAFSYAEQNDTLMLFGIPQKEPNVHYGFIEIADNTHDPCSVVAFHEKPTIPQTELYFKDPAMFWNSGIVCARLSLLWHLFEQHAPYIIEHLDTYHLLPAVSFDKALLEKATASIRMLPAPFAWSDLGTLNSFIPSIQAEQDLLIELNNALHNKSYTSKPVVISHLSHLCIIETADMILVIPAESMDQLPQVAATLQERGYSHLLQQ